MAFRDEVINGTDIVLSIDGDPIACATSFSLEVTPSVRDTSSKDSGDFTEAISGRISWSVSTDALINLGTEATKVSYAEFMTLVLAGDEVDIEAKYDQDELGTDVITFTGTCIITSVNLTAGDQDNGSFSVSLQGTGPLVQA